MSNRVLWRRAIGLYNEMATEGRCFRCSRPSTDIDHVVPVLRGGKNKPWNWQPLCHPCNANKGARHEQDYRPEPFRSLLMDIGMQLDPDMSADGRWLTYDQIASLRRIDKPSAIKLATRHQWERRKSNRGQIQVLVPVDWLDRAQERRDKYTDKSEDKPDIIGALREAFQVALMAKVSEITAKDELIEGLRRDVAETRSAQVRAELALGTAQEALRQAEQREVARLARGRLRAAWRALRGK